MTEHELVNGCVLDDGEIEARAAGYESGDWEGRLESLRPRRAPAADESLVTAAVKFPAPMVDAIDRKTDKRSGRDFQTAVDESSASAPWGCRARLDCLGGSVQIDSSMKTSRNVISITETLEKM